MWICIKLKQIQLITIKNTPNWSRMREQNPHSRICAGVWVLCLQKREAITNMKDKERFREVYGKP